MSLLISLLFDSDRSSRIGKNQRSNVDYSKRANNRCERFQIIQIQPFKLLFPFITIFHAQRTQTDFEIEPQMRCKFPQTRLINELNHYPHHPLFLSLTNFFSPNLVFNDNCFCVLHIILKSLKRPWKITTDATRYNEEAHNVQVTRKKTMHYTRVVII